MVTVEATVVAVDDVEDEFALGAVVALTVDEVVDTDVTGIVDPNVLEV